MNRATFDNPAVAAATNPSATYGYTHGPVPNNNPGWVPPRQAAAVGRPPTVTAADNANPPNAAVRLSAINGSVCMIQLLPGDATMCGIICASQPALRRHIRNAHPGATLNPDRTNTSLTETVTIQNALKRFVLFRGWRNALFAAEPGRGPIGGLLDQYATACETIAHNDATFAASFGEQFHREPVPVPRLSRKRKRGPSPPAPDDKYAEPPAYPTPTRPTTPSRKTKKKAPPPSSTRKSPRKASAAVAEE